MEKQKKHTKKNNDDLKKDSSEVSFIKEEMVKTLDEKEKEIADLKTLIEVKEKEKEELNTSYQDALSSLKNALSDYQNLKKRVEVDKLNAQSMSDSIILRQFLDIVDDINLYIAHMKKNGESSPFMEGIRNIYAKCMDIISSQGLVVQEVKVGDNYSPLESEVVGTVIGDEDNKVTEIVRVGYLQNGKIVRPVRVIVSKKQI